MLSAVLDTFKEHIDLKVTYTNIPAEKACKSKLRINDVKNWAMNIMF